MQKMNESQSTVDCTARCGVGLLIKALQLGHKMRLYIQFSLSSSVCVCVYGSHSCVQFQMDFVTGCEKSMPNGCS